VSVSSGFQVEMCSVHIVHFNSTSRVLICYAAYNYDKIIINNENIQIFCYRYLCVICLPYFLCFKHFMPKISRMSVFTLFGSWFGAGHKCCLTECLLTH